MEIRNLITFVHVAELNSFTKAARALDYAQSTISFQIKQLEEELGFLLFERINHTISITDRGRELLEYAKQIRQKTEEFHDILGKTGAPSGHVHIVAPDSVCEDMLTRDCIDFYREYPGISIKFTNVDTVEMYRMLDHNEADLLLSLDSHAFHSDYIIAKEIRVPMHFVAGSESKYALDGPVSIYDIANFPFILTEKNMGYRRSLDEELAKKSVQIDPILEIGRTDIISSVVEAGIAVSFLPDFVTKKRVESGSLKIIDVTDIHVDIWKQLVYHKNKWLSKSLSALIEYIKTHEFEE